MTGFPNDLKVAARSLVRAKGMSATVVLTLALGIGANAAIFTLVRGVLLRPLVNRDESHLVYIRQSASAEGIENTTFSVPEIKDLQDRLKSISKFGDFSTIGFTLIGLGAPREVRAGVVSGSYFDVVGSGLCWDVYSARAMMAPTRREQRFSLTVSGARFSKATPPFSTNLFD